jgi:hypothetical protein
MRQRDNLSAAPVTKPNVNRFVRPAASASTFLVRPTGRTAT